MPENPLEPKRPAVHQSGELLQGRLPANRRLRLTNPSRQSVTVPERSARRRRMHPAAVLLSGFTVLILVGTVALSLPIASASGAWTDPLTALFTSTSAVCVTGLVVVDTATHWSGAGHVMILLLFQAGGLGFMTSSTLVFLALGHRVTLRERVLIREALSTQTLGSTVSIVRGVLYFTLVAEAIGAAVLAVALLGHMDGLQALWWGLFHSVSAFNNAGFDLTGGFRSIQDFHDQPAVVIPIGILAVVGAISFAVVTDLLGRRQFKRLTADTKLVLTATAGLVALGVVGLLFTERDNQQTLGGMEFATRVMNAVFAAAAGRTAGFSTMDTAAMTDGGLALLLVLMFIGGAAGSTAGGIKLQTFGILFAAIVSTVRGETSVVAFQRRIPLITVMRAISITLVAFLAVLVVTLLLEAFQQTAIPPALFEAVSAVGTVGSSTGITPDLTPLSRLVVIIAMFIGRIGPLTLIFALAARDRPPARQWPEDSVRLG